MDSPNKMFALLILGICYYKGWGCDKNTTNGLKLLQMSKDEGLSLASEVLEEITIKQDIITIPQIMPYKFNL